MTDPCNGCTEWDGKTNDCCIYLAYTGDKCICSECMVKMLCFSPCVEFNKLWDRSCKILGVEFD